MYIMHKDIPVFRFDLEEGIYDVLNDAFLPYELLGCIKKTPEDAPMKEQLRALSMGDCYWIKGEDETRSIVSAEEVYRNCACRGKNFLDTALSIDSEMIYKTCIVDYLISNPDRHRKNWGFYRDNGTGALCACHPLFDHNRAFDADDMAGDGGESLIFCGMSKKEAALDAMKKCDFKTVKPLTRDLFLDGEMYDSFMRRACELGLYRKQTPNFLQKIGVLPFSVLQ
jgi:hypothetical protein